MTVHSTVGKLMIHLANLESLCEYILRKDMNCAFLVDYKDNFFITIFQNIQLLHFSR